MHTTTLGLLSPLAGCAATTGTAYLYAPAVHANARLGDYPAAYYPIPADRPTGDVRMASFGLTAVQPQGGGPTTNVAQVRLIVTNNVDDVPWMLDTRDATLSLLQEGSSRAAFVNTNAGTPPVIQIARGEQRTRGMQPSPPRAPFHRVESWRPFLSNLRGVGRSGCRVAARTSRDCHRTHRGRSASRRSTSLRLSRVFPQRSPDRPPFRRPDRSACRFVADRDGRRRADDRADRGPSCRSHPGSS